MKLLRNKKVKRLKTIAKKNATTTTNIVVRNTHNNNVRKVFAIIIMLAIVSLIQFQQQIINNDNSNNDENLLLSSLFSIIDIGVGTGVGPGVGPGVGSGVDPPQVSPSMGPGGVRPEVVSPEVGPGVVAPGFGPGLIRPGDTNIIISNQQKDATKPPPPSSSTASILDELDILTTGGGGRGRGRAADLDCPHPLIPFQNVIIREEDDDDNQNDVSSSSSRNKNNMNNTMMMIPKILHVTMKSRCLPRDLAITMDRWKQVLPNFSIFFHDDDAVESLFINNDQNWELEFPNLSRVMKCILFKGAMKIDVWRLLILWKCGGIYTDIDNWPTSKFNETFTTTTTFLPSTSNLSAFFFRDAYNRPSQWFIASIAKHPILKLTIQGIIQNLLSLENIRKPNVVFTTGPHALKFGYANFIRRRNNYHDNNMTMKEIFQNDKIMMGINNLTVYKTSRNKKLLLSKNGYKEIVPYNSTLNVTRRQRIAMDSGITHWQYTIKNANDKLPAISCKEYLSNLDDGTMEEVEAI